MVPDLRAAAQHLFPDLVDLRRLLHRFPEQGNHLPETRRIVLEALEGLPLHIVLHETTSGVVAVLEGGRPGPVTLLRADMDALPITEETGLEFASSHDGFMHACGHDLHTAMLVGAARLLSSMKSDLAGTVLFMFQPGEEGFAGARFMLEEGLLATVKDRPSGAFAIHVNTWTRSGMVLHRKGPQLASADEARVTIRGKGGHASAPYLSYDPIPVAAEIVLATQTAITRRINVFEPGVITFATVAAGTTHNVIPETASMVATIRAVSESTRDQLHALINRVVPSIAAAHGVEAEVEIKLGYPVTVNDPDHTAWVDKVARDTLGDDQVVWMDSPIMAAEDWGYVLREVPGTMSFLGACPPDLEPGRAPGLHSDRAVFDEETMITGVALHAAVALSRGRRSE
ncbi:MAG: amidohydrolase [Acidimicrobiia bacterium]|nr:amidohydrolase [Acidimicrobiia bacterium]MYF83366.1 amidohydrolase [Acidimicrobiia bacterium]